MIAYRTLNVVTFANSIMIERLACRSVRWYVSIGLSGPTPFVVAMNTSEFHELSRAWSVGSGITSYSTSVL